MNASDEYVNPMMMMMVAMTSIPAAYVTASRDAIRASEFQ